VWPRAAPGGFDVVAGGARPPPCRFDSGMMRRWCGIRAAAQPDEVLLVVDSNDRPRRRPNSPAPSTTGGAHRRGASPSRRRQPWAVRPFDPQVSGAPIKFIGNRRKGRPCSPSTRRRMASRILLGMGDVLTWWRKPARRWKTGGMWRKMQQKLQEAHLRHSPIRSADADDQTDWAPWVA